MLDWMTHEGMWPARAGSTSSGDFTDYLLDRMSVGDGNRPQPEKADAAQLACWVSREHCKPVELTPHLAAEDALLVEYRELREVLRCRGRGRPNLAERAARSAAWQRFQEMRNEALAIARARTDQAIQRALRRCA